MCIFDKETVLIWFHVGQSLQVQLHEPQQAQAQGPQQVLDI